MSSDEELKPGGNFMAPVTCFGYQRSFVLIVATLIVPMTGVAAYPQHPHRASQPASSDPAWAELQQSMQSMHETMSSLESAGNDRTADSIRWHWRPPIQIGPRLRAPTTTRWSRAVAGLASKQSPSLEERNPKRSKRLPRIVHRPAIPRVT
jgi:hypothetical protein